MCQQKPVNFTVCCKNKYAEKAVRSVVLCMFLQYIDLKNCKILQCIVKFYMHLLYFLQYNVNFTGVGWQIGCQLFYCKIYISLQCTNQKKYHTR